MDRATKGIIGLYIFLVMLFFCGFLVNAFSTRKEFIRLYNSAVDIITMKDYYKYDEAVNTLEDLGDYQEAYHYIDQAIYEQAVILYNEKEYDRAADLFEKIPEFLNSSKIYITSINRMEQKYQEVQGYLEQSDYKSALNELDFLAIMEYKDSGQLQILAKIANDATTISAGTGISAALTQDGTVLCSTNKDSPNQSHFSMWSGIKSISVMGSLGIGLKSDGTVLTAGKADGYRIETSMWRDIVQISAGDLYVVGLTNDGRVLAQGHNGDDQIEIDSWTGIVDIDTGWRHTVGLDKIGNVHIVGIKAREQLEEIAKNRDDWRDLVSVAAGGGDPGDYGAFTVGLRADGTAVAVGENSLGQCDVADWTGITQISAGQFHTVGLREDGTVMTTQTGKYDRDDRSIYEEVSGWTDIVAVSAGYGTTIGLKSDGTIVGTGYHLDGQLEIDSWSGLMLPVRKSA